MGLKKIIRGMFGFILNLVRGLLDRILTAYQYCQMCGKYYKDEIPCLICPSCRRLLSKGPNNTCDICGKPLVKGPISRYISPDREPRNHKSHKHKSYVGSKTACTDCTERVTFFKSTVYLGVYTGYLKSLISSVKYGGDINMGYAIGQMMGDAVDAAAFVIEAELIIPVPLDDDRIKERGFNQAEILARGLGDALRLPVEPYAVVKKKTNREQKKTGRNMRSENVRNCFEVVDYDLIKGRNIIVVDDIMTTGSTLNEISGLLVRGGAVNVYAAVGGVGIGIES